MKIVFDGAVKEYVQCVTASMFFSEESPFEMVDDTDERNQELIFMHVLEMAVTAGAAVHSYDRANGIDEFSSTDRLLKHWQWWFPGAEPCVSREERFELIIRGRREQYIGAKFAQYDPANPPPSWPN